MKKFLRLFWTLTFLVFSSSFLWADNSTNYDDISFPQWTKDLRRTEVITFGSLPFVTLWTSLGYGLAVKGTFHNPLDKSTSGYSEKDQKNIMMIAAGTSLCLGLTDLLLNVINRKIKDDKASKVQKSITVIPFSQQSLEFEQQSDEEQLIEKQEIPQEYFIKGLENAIF